jgi:hypothetical protein
MDSVGLRPITIMKFLRPLLSVIPAFFFVSCADMGMYPPGGFGGGGFGGGGPGFGGGGWGGPGFGGGGWGGPGFGGGGWGGGGPGFGYNRFGGGHVCSRCNRNPCGCGGHSGHAHQQSRGSSSSDQRKYRILAGDLDGKKRPNDFQTLDWYHSRGYSLQNVKVETDRGTVIDRRPSSQRSSSSSNASSSSKRTSGSSNSSSNSNSNSNKSSSSGNLRDHMKAQLSKKK